MIEFMLLAAPRSGTTWAANWLTTDTTLCFHDPLFTYHYTDLDQIKSRKHLGISCTGLSYFPKWVNCHPARKIVLHRDIDEVNESLKKIGLPPVVIEYMNKLASIEATHLPWTDLFERPKFIYETLLELPFDEERHTLLREIEMQPDFERISIGNHTKRILNEIQQVMRGN